jgi:hypothetical protein
MGLMNAVIAGITGAAKTGAEYYGSVARSEAESRIALDKAKAMDEYSYNKKKERAPEELAMRIAEEEALGGAKAKTAALTETTKQDALLKWKTDNATAVQALQKIEVMTLNINLHNC